MAMRKILLPISTAGLVFCSWVPHAAASAFVNLDFESARLPTIPQGQVGFEVAATTGLPGWSVLGGGLPMTWVLHNNVSGGPAAASVFGPDWPYGRGGRIDGDYTAFLAASLDPLHGSIAIAQTGLLPAESQWLLFKGRAAAAPPVPSEIFTVSLGGQAVPVSVLETYGDYSLYGGLIGGFAGREVELRFIVPGGSAGSLRLDSIMFSPVPEPGVPAFFGLGVFVLGLWRWLHARRERT